jgi:hypothetical protein
MTLTWLRMNALTLASLLLLPPASSAFDTPLSDTAIREAYFLGQHHDQIFADFLQKYVVALPEPKNGPHIASISFFTPYAVAAIYSNQQSSSYSAQKAQLDHRKQSEFVRIVVQIWFTASYGEYIIRPANSRPNSPKGFEFRPYDFWRQFRVRVFQKEQFLVPVYANGEPSLMCLDDCELSGATLTFEYPADSFTADAVTVLVTPPEGEPVAIDFDPASLR